MTASRSFCIKPCSYLPAQRRLDRRSQIRFNLCQGLLAKSYRGVAPDILPPVITALPRALVPDGMEPHLIWSQRQTDRRFPPAAVVPIVAGERLPEWDDRGPAGGGECLRNFFQMACLDLRV